VLETALAELRVPLFVLGSADAEGCTASFNLEKKYSNGAHWSVKIVGNGFTSSAYLETTTHVTFTANSGECKVVFLPVAVAMQRVDVLRGGRRIGSSLFQVGLVIK
jgi:hypothetical protein